MRKIVIFGASGSIGSQCLNVIRRLSDELEVVAISIYDEYDKLDAILSEFPTIKFVWALNPDKKRYPNVTFVDCLEDLAGVPRDVAVMAISGFAALKPTWRLLDDPIDLALANKECLVAAGDFIMRKAKENNVDVYPIDSEHSALYQCLRGEDISAVKNLIITASGGPFLHKKADELKNVSVAEAIRHPTWVMGPKISIDCATMANKGLEVIEAHHLFNTSYDRIKVVLHPESVVHSLVEFTDGSLKALAATPNMEIPLQYALCQGKRKENAAARFNFGTRLDLHFYPLDFARFPAVKLAYDVGRKGGSSPIVYNAANEEAVSAFINGEISFTDIIPLVHRCVETFKYRKVTSIDDVYRVDREARELARKFIEELTA